MGRSPEYVERESVRGVGVASKAGCFASPAAEAIVLLPLDFFVLGRVGLAPSQRMPMMKKTGWFAATVAAVLLGGAAQADELGEETQKFCEKMKHCALDDVAASDLSADMKQMISQQLDMACAGIQARFDLVTRTHALYGPAVACVKSMQAMSCEDIQQSDDSVSAECERYQQMAENY